MKRKFLIFILLVFGLLAISIFVPKQKAQAPVTTEPKTEVTTNSTIPTTGEYCFVRNQKATDAAPYNVEEHVVLDFDGTRVTGQKRGMQAGPDMTNGYEGTLTGSTIEYANGEESKSVKEIELTYDYTVEGAENRELEVYTFSDGNLIKNRWVLHDEKINNKSILVPDYKGDPTLITYAPEKCDN